jgi:ribosome-binding protein aMBF1 (putative translation factor)
MKKQQLENWEDVEKKLFEQTGFVEAINDTALEYQVAHSIIDARIQRGMTQADLAKAMNTKQSVISRAENAKTVPSLSFLKRLAFALGASLQVQLKFSA